MIELDQSAVLGIHGGTLPRRRIDGKVMVGGVVRCILETKEVVNHDGRSSLIQRAIRTDSSGQLTVAIKRPRKPELDLTAEALLQYRVYHLLAQEGIVGAVPEVYDLYRNAAETHISMEWIEGHRVDMCLYMARQSGTLDAVFLDIVRQLAAILHVIHRSLSLDHRDMRPDNIWVRDRPVNYTVGNRQIQSTRQLVLLDFGFACLGDSNRTMTLNLGNAIPDMDWCPKPGRDMYVLVNRLLDLPGIEDGLSPELRNQILSWMRPAGRANPYRVHLDTSDPKFELPGMTPEAILEQL